MTLSQMKKMPTEGPWLTSGNPVKQSNYGVYKQCIYTTYERDGTRHIDKRVNITADTKELAQEFAKIAAEAGTVFHETGLSPRQLADELEKLRGTLETAEIDIPQPHLKKIEALTFQRNELLEACEYALKAIENYPNKGHPMTASEVVLRTAVMNAKAQQEGL